MADLSEAARETVIAEAVKLAEELHERGLSLAIAREAWIEAFDHRAEQLDSE